MSLEFRPFVAINPNETSRTQKGMEQLNQTFNNVGNQALQYRQQQLENARQQQLMDIQKQQAQQQMDANRPLSYYTNNYQGENGQSMQVPPDYQGASSSGSLQQGTTGPQPNPNYQNAQGGSSYQQGSGMPIDHTQHFQNWMQMGQPAKYDHPDYGGSGQITGARTNPMQQHGGFDWNTYSNLPAPQASRYAEGAKLQSEMPGGMNSKYANGSQADDIASGKFNTKNWPGGVIPQWAVESTGTSRRFLTGQGTKTDEQNKTFQEKARTAAQGIYKNYTDKDQQLQTGLDAIAQASSNPATFNTALMQIAPALGITARNPQRVIDAIARGNPSLLGRMQEASSVGLKGQMTDDLKQGLAGQLGNLQSSNRQQFERLAKNHIAQSKSYYNNDMNTATQDLFPTYDWNANKGGDGTIKVGRFNVTPH